MRTVNNPDLDAMQIEITAAQVEAFKQRSSVDRTNGMAEAALAVAASSDHPAIREAYDHLLFLLALCDETATRHAEDSWDFVFESIYRNQQGALNRRFFVETAIIERVRAILFNGSPDEIERLKIFMSETRRE